MELSFFKVLPLKGSQQEGEERPQSPQSIAHPKPIPEQRVKVLISQGAGGTQVLVGFFVVIVFLSIVNECMHACT